VREVDVSQVTESIAELLADINYNISPDIKEALGKSLNFEYSDVGKDVLSQLLLNIDIASRKKIPLCQDCGYAVVFIEIGQDVHLVGGDLDEAINRGVSISYRDNYLRKSILKDPIRHIDNTGDNTPAVIWKDIVPGSDICLHVCAKGGGSENMSAVRMLKPSDGLDGLKAFVIDTVRVGGANACPPILVGVGVGGTFEKCAWLSKKSLFRKIGERNRDQFLAQIESDLLEEINNLDIGPAGLGGRTTALDVFIEQYPCHIASFPVAVNIQCHSSRHKSIII